MKIAGIFAGLLLVSPIATTLHAQTPPLPSADRGGEQSVTNETHAGINTQKFADGTEVSSDFSSKPAVLCMWELNVAMLALGRQCGSIGDKEFNEGLEDSINKYNAFIVKNSHHHPVTFDQINSSYKKKLEKYQTPEICHSDLVGMYKHLKEQGAAALKAATSETLSIPREPVMNPCF